VTTAAELHAAWRALPVGRLDDVIGPGPCLILAPHPDDESLGCGGLIAACCAAGRPPVVAILTDGAGSHPHSRRFPPSRLAILRAAEVRRAVGILGLPPERLFLMNEPDTRVPREGSSFDRIVDRLHGLLCEHRCVSVLGPWAGDPHGDHVAAAIAAVAAARAAAVRSVVYPVWGWMLTGELPDASDALQGWRLDIAAHRDAKRRAISAHESQYGGVIDDDPTGFQLPKALLRAVDSRWETYLSSS
jgi:LmbE family N-acetylglucosaminyl deacetylase